VVALIFGSHVQTSKQKRSSNWFSLPHHYVLDFEGQNYHEIAKSQHIIDVSSFDIVTILQVVWDIVIIVQSLIEHEEIHQFF
jgi:hypothetical protein